jgi:hypothetical protein
MLYIHVSNSIIYLITNDTIIADYIIPSSINILYLCIYSYLSFMHFIHHTIIHNTYLYIISNLLDLLLGYYIYDTIKLLSSKQKNKWSYILHHIVTIQLLIFHGVDVLPLSIGIPFLTFFEISNLFLIPYQLCNEKQWTNLKYKLTKPMVFTYVPFRLFVIPYWSIFYFSHMKNMHYLLYYYITLMIGLINLYSMYYGMYIGYKYTMYIYNTRFTH